MDQPMMECPRCGEEMEDFDGFGVLAHEDCGYCTHPSRDGDGRGNMVCGICGDVERPCPRCGGRGLTEHVEYEQAIVGGTCGVCKGSGRFFEEAQ